MSEAVEAELRELRKYRDLFKEQVVDRRRLLGLLRAGDNAQEKLRAELDQTLLRLIEAEAVIVNAQDQLHTDHPVWWILDDYDGSMDSVKTLKAERDAARAEVLRLRGQDDDEGRDRAYV